MSHEAKKILTPRISIIAPVLNCERYIAETIESVIMQTYQNWELIIIDGKSEDKTVEIALKYAGMHNNISVISEKDEGFVHAAEKGLERARGEFICFLCGQDGFLDKDWFFKCINAFDKEKDISLVWGLVCGKSEDGSFIYDTNESYIHFLKPRGLLGVMRNIAVKSKDIVKDILFAPLYRKKIILKKLFSSGAILRINSITQKSFPAGQYPQKEDWFLYWLNTGLVFPDQSLVVSREVYRVCTPRYIQGIPNFDNFGNFVFNFNARGYLPYFIPTYANFGRDHKGNSGARVPEKVYGMLKIYFDRIKDLRKKVLRDHEEVVFRNRGGEIISRKVF